jgi:PilZ domain
MEEHRAVQRRRVLKAGTISLGGGGAISCTIRNLSETGAALEVESPVGIPDQLTLLVEAEHSSRHCEVVWRKEKRIGVRFVPD